MRSLVAQPRANNRLDVRWHRSWSGWTFQQEGKAVIMKVPYKWAVGSMSVGLAVVLAGCGSSVANAVGNSNASGVSKQSVQVVHVVASNWKWTLDKRTFSVDKPIQFDITSKQGTHGFSITGTSVSQPVSVGKNEQVTWTPPKPGTYVIRCDLYCGSGHDNMLTTFTVQ